MKTSNRILGHLFWALMGIIIFSVVGWSPAIGAIVFQPLVMIKTPKGVLGANTILTDEQKNFSDHIQQMLEKLKSDIEGRFLTTEAAKARIETILDEIVAKKGLDKFGDLETQLKELKENIAKLSLVIEKSKQQTGNDTRIPLAKAVNDIFTSESYKQYAANNGKGVSQTFELKSVSLTNDYTGSVMVTETRDRLAYEPENRLNIRDLIPGGTTDMPTIVSAEVTSWNDGVGMLSENGTPTESDFKTAEKTFVVGRIATFIKISKRMMKSTSYLVRHATKTLPKKIRYQEDFQILFGDGLGDNLNGLMKQIPTLTLDGTTGAAGSIASIASYNGGAQTIVTFAALHGLRSGFTITFASTTGYNSTYNVTIVNGMRILIDAAYSAQATAAWTYSTKHPFYHEVDNAQEADCLKVALGAIEFKESSATGGILNPADATRIELLKDSTSQYIRTSIVRKNGVLYIDNFPFILTTAMPAGQFVVGDFQQSIEIADYTPLSIYFTDDVSYKLNNQVAMIAEAEMILAVYNKYMFAKGDFKTLKAQLEKP